MTSKPITLALLLLASAANADDDNTVTIKVDGYSGPLSVSDETCRVDDLLSAAQAMLAIADPPQSDTTFTTCSGFVCSYYEVESERLERLARKAKRKEDEITKARETIERCAYVLQKAAAAPTTAEDPIPQASASETR
jgi:hypothetical protein